MSAHHLLRSIHRFVDLIAIREHLRPFYSEMGRPSIDPELMIRMLIIGYCFGIRSDGACATRSTSTLSLVLPAGPPRRSAGSLDFLEEPTRPFPSQRSAAPAVRDDGEALPGEGLVGGDGFAVDASLIRAEANRQRFVPREEGLPPDASSRAIDEYLAVLGNAAFGGATDVLTKRLSPSDPAASYTSAHGGKAEFCYATLSVTSSRISRCSTKTAGTRRFHIPRNVVDIRN